MTEERWGARGQLYKPKVKEEPMVMCPKEEEVLQDALLDSVEVVKTIRPRRTKKKGK